MATTITIPCPKCKKAMNGPESLQGKKIKCKACGEAFLVPTAKSEDAKGKAAPAAKANPKAGAPKGGDDEEWGIVKAYGVTSEEDTARCPYCASELDSDDAVLCLKCGYNLQTRTRMEEKILQPVTGGDYFLWLLPGILCAILALSFAGGIVFCVIGLVSPPAEWVGSGLYKSFMVYSIVICGFVVFFTAKFAIKRLIFNPHPPDKEKFIKKEKEE